ncbi:hemerythrin domain-containing protein [Lentzea sp. NPDC034063]|uniref:hemerythrin domain-containing protein n=1 Tax=unclassified Lentzea TaxID=2643253 RepID=UPI0033C8639F
MPIDPNAPADKPETQQMKVIHRAMRREFSLLPGLVAAVAPGDVPRAELLAGHLRLMLDMLHGHHEAEDELLWPVLTLRAPVEHDLIAIMEKQHDAIAQAITLIEQVLPDWAGTASAVARDRLAAALRDLEPTLTEHLDLEENAVLPLIHEHLTVPEWLAPQKHAMKHGPKSLTAKLTIAGLVLEDATEPERAWFLHELPPPARLLWRFVGRKRYATHIRALRLTS